MSGTGQCSPVERNRGKMASTDNGKHPLSKDKGKAEWRRAKESRRKKQLVTGTGFISFLVAGWFFPLVGYFIPFCMLMGIGFALFKGRKWCDWLCPRGGFADAILKTVSPGKQIPAVLKGLPLRLAVLSFLMIMLTVQIVRLWPDPFAIGGFFMVLLTVTTAVGVILGLTFHQRAWCYICPIGTLSNWVGKNRYQLSMDKDRCTDCKVCGKTCPMELTPYTMKHETEMANKGDCLKCGLCTTVCPKKVLQFPVY